MLDQLSRQDPKCTILASAKTVRFGLKLGVFLKAPSPLVQGSSPPSPISLTPTHQSTNTDSVTPPAHPPPTQTIPTVHPRLRFRRSTSGTHFRDQGSIFPKKKNLEKISKQQVSLKFLEGFCCLKCIEGFYCDFGWLLVDSKVVTKPHPPHPTHCVAFYLS